MIIRALEARDREGWLAMRRDLWPDSAGEHEHEIDRFFRGESVIPEAVLVAELEGELAGFAELSVRQYAEGCETSRVGYLEGWYVLPGHRRTGVGAALVSAAEDWARGRGCVEFASDTSPDNEVSIAAHAACGFEKAGLVVCFRRDIADRGLSPRSANPRLPGESRRSREEETGTGA